MTIRKEIELTDEATGLFRSTGERTITPSALRDFVDSAMGGYAFGGEAYAGLPRITASWTSFAAYDSVGLWGSVDGMVMVPGVLALGPRPAGTYLVAAHVALRPVTPNVDVYLQLRLGTATPAAPEAQAELHWSAIGAGDEQMYKSVMLAGVYALDGATGVGLQGRTVVGGTQYFNQRCVWLSARRLQ